MAATGADAATSTVTQSLELRLYGQVPVSNAFFVEYRITRPDGSAVRGTRTFCGVQSVPVCRGGGVYRGSVSAPKGSTISVRFIRQQAGDDYVRQVFYSDTHKLDYDYSNIACYRFGG